jgi:hypothetical protein
MYPAVLLVYFVSAAVILLLGRFYLNAEEFIGQMTDEVRDWSDV